MATKKDYEAIAAIISDARGRRTINNPLERVLYLERNLMDYFKSENPRFDGRKFEIACMSTEEGTPCGHARWSKEGVFERCAEMACWNYVSKHMPKGEVV